MTLITCFWLVSTSSSQWIFIILVVMHFAPFTWKEKFHQHNLDKFLITACANSEWAGSNNTPLHCYTCTRVWWITPASLWQELSYKGEKLWTFTSFMCFRTTWALYSQKLTNWQNNCLNLILWKFLPFLPKKNPILPIIAMG